jgi:hypothetical protein
MEQDHRLPIAGPALGGQAGGGAALHGELF